MASVLDGHRDDQPDALIKADEVAAGLTAEALAPLRAAGTDTEGC